jgi:hypothetical protein
LIYTPLRGLVGVWRSRGLICLLACVAMPSWVDALITTINNNIQGRKAG